MSGKTGDERPAANSQPPPEAGLPAATGSRRNRDTRSRRK